MKKNIILTILFVVQFAQSQTPIDSVQKIWTLEACIDYALDNNISVKQAELSKNITEASYLAQPKWQRLPEFHEREFNRPHYKRFRFPTDQFHQPGSELPANPFPREPDQQSDKTGKAANRSIYAI